MDKKLNVLVIEDNQADAEMNIRILRTSGYNVHYERVENGEQMTIALNRGNWDIILSDYSMPRFSVQSALEIYYAHGIDIPFIVISGTIGEEKAVELVKAGVHDILVKGKMSRFITIVEKELREASKRRGFDTLSSSLEQSKQRYKRYIDHAPDGVFILDEKGNYIEVNPAACAMSGYSSEELLTLSVPDILTESSQLNWLAHLNSLITNGSLQADIFVRRKSGELRWWVLEATRLSDNLFLCFTIDITRRKEMEENLRSHQVELELQNDELLEANSRVEATSLKYSELYDFAPSAYFTLSKGKVIQDLNYSGTRMLASDRSKLLGTRFDRVVSGNTLPAFNLFFRNVFKSNSKQVCELILEAGGERPKYVHVEGITVGQDNQCLMNVIDITGRKQTEVLLQQMHHNFETFFNAIDDFLFVLDGQGAIIHCNNTVIQRLGYSPEELTGQSVLMVHPPELRKEAGKIIAGMLRGEVDYCNVPIMAKSGFRIEVETRISKGHWNGKPAIYGVSKDITQIKLSEEKFSKVFYLNPSACGLDDYITGKYIEVNEAFSRLLGFVKEEVIGKTPLELGILTVDSRNQLLQSIADKGHGMNIETNLVAKNGDVKHVMLSAEIINIQEKKYRYTVVHDVTERKQAEVEIRRVNGFLDSVIDNIPDMIFIKDAKDLRFVRINRAGEELLGFTQEELVGKSDFDFLPKETAAGFVEKDREALSNKRLTDIPQEPIQTRHKGVRILHTQKMPMFDDQGEPEYLLGISLDITDLQREEQARKVSDEKYRTMLNASPDGILLIDLRGIISEASEIGLEIFGAMTRNDLVGKNCLSFVPSEERRAFRDLYEKTINEGLAQNIELKIRKRNNTLFPAEISTTLIQSQDGTPLSFMIIIRDISQRKKMETKLMHSDRMANLGEMAAGIAHEINQPLNIISMVMDKILFEKAKTGSEDQDFLVKKSEKIFDNITRIRNIIDHVRTFSRTQDDYLLTAFDINSSIENAVSMIAEQFKHLGISLDLQLDRDLPQIHGNTYKFEQVMINLLVNAKDAVIDIKGHEGTARELIVDIRSYSENGYLIVEVADNGIGISTDDISNIMLPFYTTKDEGKGTGLGLSICYQIIKSMGGTIEVVSNKMHGTIVKILLTSHL